MRARTAARTRMAETEARIIVTLEGELPMLLLAASNGDEEGKGLAVGVRGMGESGGRGGGLSGITNGLGNGASLVLPSSETLRAVVELVHCRDEGKTSKLADVLAKRAGTVSVEQPVPRITTPTSTGWSSSSY